MDANIIALIPIKEHSERLPEKNFRLFSGIPLYEVILYTLSHCTHIEKIYIDTDSERIAEGVQAISKKIHIILRQNNLCGDDVSVNHIIDYDLSQIDGERFLQTHCTNPLLKTGTIDHAIELYMQQSGRYDSLFSVTKIQSRLYDYTFKAINHDPSILLRTQDLKPLYEENSNLYVFSRASFYENNKNRIGRNPYLFEMGTIESIDIDNEDDFILAEMLYEQRKSKIEHYA